MRFVADTGTHWVIPIGISCPFAGFSSYHTLASDTPTKDKFIIVLFNVPTHHPFLASIGREGISWRHRRAGKYPQQQVSHEYLEQVERTPVCDANMVKYLQI
jgi:hypothetical protein